MQFDLRFVAGSLAGRRPTAARRIVMSIRRLLGICAGLSLSACMASAPAVREPKKIEVPTTPPAPQVNPFDGASLYVNPDFTKVLDTVAGRAPGQAAGLKKAGTFSTAIWLDTIERVKDVQRYLDDAAAQQKAGGKPVVAQFVVYDLPNRDCAAEASNGELTIAASGEARYQTEYVDAIAAQFAAHPDQRIVAILEPDSLANIATNLGQEKCAQSEAVYRRSVAYAITKLSLPNVYIYLDAAHAGWLGWRKNLTKIATIYKEVLAMAGGPDRIRGFALNVSNYDPVKNKDWTRHDPNEPGPDELTYASDLAETLAKSGIAGKGYIIDTARNGRANIRTAPGNWCNIKGAGLGERPTVAPAPNVDAYLWIKTPGESDGTADSTAPRFDPNCASDDATPGAPQAGKLFEPYLIDLVKNANPPL
jgi:cellulose 1,4-beta-cellobiosidase